MSGVCGWVNWDAAPVPPEGLQRMIHPVAYRGPDGIRSWNRDGAAFAHLALNITPESSHEIQPLEDEKAELILVADARIDNRDELIAKLRGTGAVQEATPTDAGLILAAYRKWDDNCLQHLVGDFAFAIWDARRRRLLLARDPMAMRNLHFRVEPRRFLFATEAKQIRAAPNVPNELFLPAVGAYLAGGNGSPEWTFHAGIQRFLPGNGLVVERDRMHQWRYWDPAAKTRIRYRTDGEYADHLGELMKTAVRSRLRSIHPTGLLLSGGVDSGAVAATAGWLLENERDSGIARPRAYCFAWDELSQCDERRLSGPLAELCGLPVSDVPADDAWPFRPGSECSTDADTPFLPMHFALLQHAHDLAQNDGIRLMLGGDRGDAMWGLDIYDFPSLLWSGRWVTLLSEIRALAHWQNRGLRRLARAEFLRVLRESVHFYRHRWASLPPPRKRTSRGRPHWPHWLSNQMIQYAEQAREEAWLEPLPHLPSNAARERYRSIFTPLYMQGIEPYERMIAARQQTFADPWSDTRIAEFACQVPQRTLNRVGRPKLLARRALQRMVPALSVESMQKTSPSPLFFRGFCDRERSVVEALIRDSWAARHDLLDRHGLERAYQAVCADRPSGLVPVWRALTLEWWLRTRGSDQLLSELN